MHALRPLLFSRVRDRVFVAVVHDDGFSTQLAAVPLKPEELVGLMSLLGEAKTPQERIDGFFLGGGDHGHLTLTVEKPLSAAAYETMRSGVEAHPTTTAGFWKDSVLRLDSELPTPNEHDIAGTEEALDIPQAGTGRGGAFFKLSPEATRDSSTTDRHEHVSGTEWYPPLPQNAGFNVFGPMTALTIGSAVGNLSVAGHPRAIDTPESLRLTDLHDLRDASSQQSVVSVPMTVASNAAHLEFATTASVAVGGEAFSPGREAAFSWLGVVLYILGGIASLVGVAGAGYTLVRWLHGPRPG